MKQGARWWRRDERGAGSRRPGDEPARAAGDPLTLASDRPTNANGSIAWRRRGADGRRRIDRESSMRHGRMDDDYVRVIRRRLDGRSTVARRPFDGRLTAAWRGG